MCWSVVCECWKVTDFGRGIVGGKHTRRIYVNEISYLKAVSIVY